MIIDPPLEAPLDQLSPITELLVIVRLLTRLIGADGRYTNVAPLPALETVELPY